MEVKFFRIAVKFLSAARLDLYEIIEVLRDLGYNITAPIPPKGFKISIGGSGPIASKGDVVVDVDTDRLIIGVSAREPEKCINEFLAVEKALTSRIEVMKEIHFYELLAELEVESKAEPFEFMRSISADDRIAKLLSDVLGEKLYVFGYRITKEGVLPYGSEWLDIEIVPSSARPHSAFYISMVYRSRDREKVLEKGKDIGKVVAALLNILTHRR